MNLQRIPLGVTQTQLCAGAPCSAIAVMEGDLFLAHQNQVPSIDAVRRRMSAGASLWAVLTSPQRRKLVADVHPGDYLMPYQVLEAVVDAATGRPRWQQIVEMTGLHDAGVRPSWVDDWLKGSCNDKGVIYRDRQDQARGSLELRLISSMSEAIEEIDRLSIERNCTLVGALTHDMHTVMLAATYVNINTCIYSAVDSLTGDWLCVNTKLAALVHEVCTIWCKPYVWETMTQTESSNLDLHSFCSASMFYLSVFTLASEQR